MKTSEILTKARELIDSPDKWTQRFYARNENNAAVTVNDDSAVCFCSIGAVHRAAGTDPIGSIHSPRITTSAIVALGQQTGESLGGHSMFARKAVLLFNDNSNHDAVLAMFDRAIADSQSKGD